MTSIVEIGHEENRTEWRVYTGSGTEEDRWIHQGYMWTENGLDDPEIHMSACNAFGLPENGKYHIY